MLRFSNVSLLVLILITNVNNYEMKICYFEKIMDRNKNFNLSCRVQLEEKWSQDGKDFLIFLVLFHLFQKIPRGSPDAKEEKMKIKKTKKEEKRRK